MNRALTLILPLATAFTVCVAAPAHAAPSGAVGCERVPLLGLEPKIRTICDGPLHPDGSWMRWRELARKEYVRSTCGGDLYVGGCPNWAKDDRDITQGWTDAQVYTVTPDAIPDGEPGHLDNGNTDF